MLLRQVLGLCGLLVHSLGPVSPDPQGPSSEGVPHLIPLFAHQAAGEESLRIQPTQQVEGQLQGKEAQEITLEQCFQAIGQMTQLCSTTQGNELVQ